MVKNHSIGLDLYTSQDSIVEVSKDSPLPRKSMYNVILVTSHCTILGPAGGIDPRHWYTLLMEEILQHLGCKKS